MYPDILKILTIGLLAQRVSFFPFFRKCLPSSDDDGDDVEDIVSCCKNQLV